MEEKTMSFNYGREKFIFDREWDKLREQYTQAGMTEEAIQDLHDFDWSWFCARRNYANHVQTFPEEEIDGGNAKTRSNLFQRFASLSTHFDEKEFSGRFAWIDTISDVALCVKLKRLSDDELELLTLIAMEGYSQREIARKMHCSQNAISKRLIKIKRILREI